jgi:hypothetical protein
MALLAGALQQSLPLQKVPDTLGDGVRRVNPALWIRWLALTR